jgi:hypothetical protein
MLTSTHTWHMSSRWNTSDLQVVTIDIQAFVLPWHRRFYLDVEEIGVKCMWAGGDSLLDVGVCCKSLVNQPLDTDFFSAGVSLWNKCSSVSGEYVEVWYVPSATHVSCTHCSQNKFLDVRVLVLFLKFVFTFCAFLYPYLNALHFYCTSCIYFH